MSEPLYLGIDFGTSGARAIAINAQQQILAEAHITFPPVADNWTDQWRKTLFQLLHSIPPHIRQHTQAIAINGTSSTVLLSDSLGNPIGPPLLYNDDRAAGFLDNVKAIAPSGHTVISATSSLTKLFYLTAHLPELLAEFLADESGGDRPIYFLHQADYLAALLHGQWGVTDYHNALKLGYDVQQLRYPDWFPQNHPFQLPTVIAPGTAIAPLSPIPSLEFPATCIVKAGTTDSIAAFLASGQRTPGTAVTSLGSTLVLKLLSSTRVDDARYGIYSHRFGEFWLVGGASNTGGAVLRHFFPNDQLRQLSALINPAQPSPYDYYPLLKPGERFPLNDPQLQPRLTPRPASNVEFLHALLESMARIEAQGYQLLQELGATPLTQVYTAGGGAQNEIWSQIRSRHLQVPVQRSPQTDAAYGSALLAMTTI